MDNRQRAITPSATNKRHSNPNSFHDISSSISFPLHGGQSPHTPHRIPTHQWMRIVKVTNNCPVFATLMFATITTSRPVGPSATFVWITPTQTNLAVCSAYYTHLRLTDLRRAPWMVSMYPYFNNRKERDGSARQNSSVYSQYQLCRAVQRTIM
jgi:hypothetical protein